VVLATWQVHDLFVNLSPETSRLNRYRFTAGYVTELIRDGFRHPHRLLNAYVQHFTGFSITDAAECVENEDEAPLPSFSQYKLDFSKLQKSRFGDALETYRTDEVKVVTCYQRYTE